MSESAATNLRERVWIEKIDKDSDPPRCVEVIFIENGQIQSVIDLTTTSAAPRPVDESTLSR